MVFGIPQVQLRDAILEAGALMPLLRHLHGAAEANDRASEGEDGASGALSGVLAHGDVVQIQHWARRLVAPLLLLCTVKDVAVTDQVLPYWYIQRPDLALDLRCLEGGGGREG